MRAVSSAPGLGVAEVSLIRPVEALFGHGHYGIVQVGNAGKNIKIY